jgi:hypothetical protein
LVDGRPLPVVPGQEGQVYARFPISIPAHEIRSFRVRYQQRLLGREAIYLVTSARSWPSPIDRAVFVIKHPEVSLGMNHRERREAQRSQRKEGFGA